MTEDRALEECTWEERGEEVLNVNYGWVGIGIGLLLVGN